MDHVLMMVVVKTEMMIMMMVDADGGEKRNDEYDACR